MPTIPDMFGESWHEKDAGPSRCRPSERQTLLCHRMSRKYPPTFGAILPNVLKRHPSGRTIGLRELHHLSLPNIEGDVGIHGNNVLISFTSIERLADRSQLDHIHLEQYAV